MRSLRMFAVSALVPACAMSALAMSEPARAAPAIRAASPLDSISADRGTVMSFNKTNRVAGDTALATLGKDVNDALTGAIDVEGEDELIRTCGDAIAIAIGDHVTPDHFVEYGFSGSIRETNGGVRSLNISVNAHRIRGGSSITARPEREIAPWSPTRRSESPHSKTRAEREGTAAAPARASTGEGSSANADGGTRSAPHT